MKVHVVMGVGVVQSKSRFVKCFELRPDLSFELPPDAGFEEELETRPRQMRRKCSVGIHQVRDLLRSRDRAPLDKRQMKPYPEVWMLSGSLHRIPGKLLPYHETRDREDPLLMRFNNCLIDRQCQAEIIPGNYDFFQCTFRAA